MKLILNYLAFDKVDVISKAENDLGCNTAKPQ